MPAYFNMSLEFQRKDISPTFTSDFQELLQKAGLKFQSGFWGSENNSLDEILAWNQKHLEANFELGFKEHYSQDYKQMLFTYDSFSYVRGFWLNNYPAKSEFTFEIIIPESEILEYYDDDRSKKEKVEFIEVEVLNAGHVHYRQQMVDVLTASALELWQSPLVKSVQTGLEIWSGVSSAAQIRSGKMPFVYPFAIVPDCFWEQMKDKGFRMKRVDSEGMLLMLSETEFC